MKKILLVIPTLNHGGAERVISELANEWAKLGHSVNLVLLVKSTDFYSVHPAVNVTRLNFDLNKNNVKSTIKLFSDFRKVIKTINPDFVLSFMDKYNVFTLMATRFLNVNVFVSDRSNPLEKLPKSVTLGRIVFYRFAKGIIAQTSLAKEILIRNLKHKNIEIIPNPVKNIENNNDIIKEKIILNVGRLVPEKGQHYLIEMMSKLKANNWKLIILGDGPLKNELEIQIDKFAIKDKVVLQGAVNNVEDWLKKASIFAFSSISEGFPNALIEAMTSGLPCVSFDCNAGPRDIIINNVNGFLVPVGDVETFTNVMQHCIDDEQARQKISSEAKKIGEQLNIKSIAQKYFDFCTK